MEQRVEEYTVFCEPYVSLVCGVVVQDKYTSVVTCVVRVPTIPIFVSLRVTSLPL